MVLLSALLLGLGVGLLSSFLGVGGGILMVPLMPHLFAIDGRVAVATSLFTVFITVFFNTLMFARRKLMDFKLIFAIGMVAALSGFLTSFTTGWVQPRTLRYILAGVLILLGCHLLLSLFGNRERVKSPSTAKGMASPVESAEGQMSEPFRLGQWVLLVTLGIGAGVLSAFTGVGSGLLLTPVLVVAMVGQPQKVVPTVNGIMAMTTSFSVLGYLMQDPGQNMHPYQLGYVRLDIAFLLLVAALSAGRIGQLYQSSLSARARKQLLVVLLFLLAGVALVP